jgi:hypothetical protein
MDPATDERPHRRTEIDDDRAMRWLLLAVLLGCHSGTHGADAMTTPQQCEASFDQVVGRACATVSDCALITHPDCCGDVVIGISAASLNAAMVAETTYNSCEGAACGARGCQHATMAEDGKVPMAGQNIVAVCTSQQCSSTVQ